MVGLSNQDRVNLVQDGNTMVMVPGIVAGQVNDINRNSGQWLIIDMGFSSREPTCGVLNRPGEPNQQLDVITFGNLVGLVTQEVQNADQRPLSLLIEAPLSVAFQPNGNPTRRICDTHGNQYRDWYVNAGAATLIAASYFLRALHNCHRQREVRLFEGFASFRQAQDRPRTAEQRYEAHIRDVRDLKDAVWYGTNREIFNPAQLVRPPNHVESAFHFFQQDLIPPVIRINPR